MSGTGISQFITEAALCARAGRMETTADVATAPIISICRRDGTARLSAACASSGCE